MDFNSLLCNPYQTEDNGDQDNSIPTLLNPERVGYSGASLDGIDFDTLLNSKDNSIHGLNLDREDIVSRLEDPNLIEHIKTSRELYLQQQSEKKNLEINEVLNTVKQKYNDTRKYASSVNKLIDEVITNARTTQDLTLATRWFSTSEVESAKKFVEVYANAALSKAASAQTNGDITTEELKKLLAMSSHILNRALLVIDAKNKIDDKLRDAFDTFEEKTLDVRQSVRNLSQEYECCIDAILNAMLD